MKRAAKLQRRTEFLRCDKPTFVSRVVGTATDAEKARPKTSSSPAKKIALTRPVPKNKRAAEGPPFLNLIRVDNLVSLRTKDDAGHHIAARYPATKMFFGAFGRRPYLAGKPAPAAVFTIRLRQYALATLVDMSLQCASSGGWANTEGGARPYLDRTRDTITPSESFLEMRLRPALSCVY